MQFTIPASKGCKFLIFFFIIGLYSTSVHSQVLTVLDSITRKPLEFVTIASEEPRAFTITSTRGEAGVKEFKGSDQIEIRMVGYRTLKTSYDELESRNFLITLAQSGVTLDQVVISATRWSQKKKDIPAKVTSISPADQIFYSPQTAADLIGQSGDVFIQKSQLGGGSPMIRGFATNRLLITVDGVRMNTAIFRSGNLQNIISLDPFAIENTEIYFGPGSVIYGSDAIGGVMSFQSLTPTLSASGKTTISGHSNLRWSSANNEKTGHIDFNLATRKFASLTSFSYSDYEDLRMGSHGPEDYLRQFYTRRINGQDIKVVNEDPEIQKPTGYSQSNFMQRFRYKPAEKWDINYGFHYSATTDYPRYDRLLRTRSDEPRSAEWYYGPQVWMMNNLSVNNNAYNRIFDRVTLRLAHQFFEESRFDRDFNDPELRNRTEKVNALSLNLDFNKDVSQTHSLFYGIEYVWNDVYSKGKNTDIFSGISQEGPSRYPLSTWVSAGAYLNYQYRFTHNLLMQNGLRYSFFSIDANFNNEYYPVNIESAKMKKGALTGSLGLVFNPGNNWSISTNLASGFRFPNVDDMGKVFDSEPGSVVVPNPDLNPEYAYNLDLGLARVFGSNLKIDLTGYYTLLENALVRRDFTMNGLDSMMYDGELSRIQAIQNAARARVYGIQAGVEIKLPSGFEFLSKLNFQKGEEELDNGDVSPSRHAPPAFGAGHLKYKYKAFLVDLNVFFSAGKKFDQLPEEEKSKTYIYALDEDGNPYSPGWYTLNLKTSYQAGKKLQLMAGVENILDKRYLPYSSGIVAPGRNFIFAVKYRF